MNERTEMKKFQMPVKWTLKRLPKFFLTSWNSLFEKKWAVSCGLVISLLEWYFNLIMIFLTWKLLHTIYLDKYKIAVQWRLSVFLLTDFTVLQKLVLNIAVAFPFLSGPKLVNPKELITQQAIRLINASQTWEQVCSVTFSYEVKV